MNESFTKILLTGSTNYLKKFDSKERFIHKSDKTYISMCFFLSSWLQTALNIVQNLYGPLLWCCFVSLKIKSSSLHSFYLHEKEQLGHFHKYLILSSIDMRVNYRVFVCLYFCVFSVTCTTLSNSLSVRYFRYSNKFYFFAHANCWYSYFGFDDVIRTGVVWTYVRSGVRRDNQR